jgi:hypothetical protein
MTIWYILGSFETFLSVLVSCSKKNLATLMPGTALAIMWSESFEASEQGDQNGRNFVY